MRNGLARYARKAPRATRAGVSFIELLMVVAIVAALTGVASMYYRNLIKEASDEKARADMRSLAKAIIKLETDQKVTIRPGGRHPQMEPVGLGVNDDGGFTLDRLLDFRIMTSIPDDPFGFVYEIDIPGGKIYSIGADGLPDSGDEVYITFRPDFEPKRAHFTNGRAAIMVEFSRKLDPFTLFAPTPAQLPFTVNSAPPVVLTTASRHITNPFAAIVRLQDPWDPVNGPVTIEPLSDEASTSGIQAMDTAYLDYTSALTVQEEY